MVWKGLISFIIIIAFTLIRGKFDGIRCGNLVWYDLVHVARTLSFSWYQNRLNLFNIHHLKKSTYFHWFCIFYFSIPASRDTSFDPITNTWAGWPDTKGKMFEKFTAQQFFSQLNPRNFKGGIGSLFDPCVNAMGQWPYWPSRMEVSYCTFGFNSIIQGNLRTLSLPCDSPRDNLHACII